MVTMFIAKRLPIIRLYFVENGLVYYFLIEEVMEPAMAHKRHPKATMREG